jgi:YD repeat-containing protein
MVLRSVVVCLLAVLMLPALARGQDPVYDASGAQYGRGFFAPLPFERIDTVTGNLFLSFTDLSLPGNGGLGLSVVRTYNSRDGRWRIGLSGVPLRVVFNSGLDNVDFLTADGAKHNAAGAGTTTMTQGFWNFTKATRKLEMPNGLVLTYGHEPSSAGAYLTEIRDPFDNTITLSWQAGWGLLQSVTQHLGGGQNRVITFANWQDDMATSMSFDGKTWTYSWQTINGAPSVQALMWVAPPGGARWYFTYLNDAQNAVKMQSLTTPNGGTVSYTWGAQNFPTTPSQRIVIQGRTTGARAPAGTWTFNWQDAGRLLQVIGPTNLVEYRTYVIDNVPVKTERKVISSGGTIIFETESVTHETLPHPINPVPAVKTVTLVRDGETYTTTYTYSTDTSHWSNYGEPTQIEEVGTNGFTRTTTLSYNHGFSKYIRGKVASVTTTVDGQASTKSFGYDGVTGFMTSSTELGSTTSYSANGQGNRASMWDPMSRRTDFSYSWGVVSGVSSPVSTVATSRGINVDGTVAWEQSTGTAQTAYGYDAAGRVTSVTSSTPNRVAVNTAYNITNYQWTSTTVTRGAVSRTTTIDGFGRPTHTQDSTGAQSRTTYNAVGEVTYRSRPFGGAVSELGDQFSYDALGRRTSTVRPDGSWAAWHYGPVTIGYQESLNAAQGQSAYRNVVQHYRWFKPGDGRMWRLVDAALGDWRYDHNGRGQLTGVSKHNDSTVPGRSWVYDANGRLASVTQPESGTTTQQVNAVGNVTQTQDALRTISYGYNGDHQPTTVDAPGTEDDITTTYDTAGRVASVTNATATTTFTYDTSSRVTQRTDVIAGHSFVQTFTYDGYDNVIRVDYPVSGRKVHYDYDAQQRLTGVRTQIAGGPLTQLAHTFVYRGDGSLDSYRYGNNALMKVTPDIRQRPVGWESGPLKLTFAYDDVSNVRSIVDDRGAGFSSQFTYDLLDRLSTVAGFGATSYTYTPGGDRLTEGTINFGYDANTRRLMSLSGGATGTFGYDLVGNMTTDPSGITYTYTAHNQQKSSQLGGLTTQYRYGGGGMRAVRTEPNGTQHLYLYGSGSGPIAEYTVVGGTPQIAREYAYLGSQVLASFAPSPVAPPPLSVTIATPSTNQTVTRGQDVQLTATASVGSGLTITRVEYYNNGLLVGQSATGTYAVTLSTHFVPITNVIIARVVASNGQAVASAPRTITVP